ncbi:VWA containing CoxE family protein [Limnofasciculus baicalensis]|uniref:VWA containing CoxE family protein n=1 Tax=Limnofasciculus baicalensis BBK-W-15 TaxID=2699891 RepID=A0AAE3GTB7_9CYAN|nr:VWA containing CoxE family protein [Limnofasciculus baicalensis]MCP2730370.1 VWA containing CoxE family protein [Limnofasciculus baicalensis BBK-W-15]
MNSFNPQNLLPRAFLRLRQEGFKLGVGELLAARKTIEGGFGEDEKALGETLKILWCHSRVQQSQFEEIWQSLLTITTPKQPEKFPTSPPESQSHRKRVEEAMELPPATTEVVTDIQPQPELASIPIQSPPILIENEDNSELQTYYPISRRSMVYRWRYLRKPVADGIMDVLDEAATIEQATHQGFYLFPLYRRRERNHAHLLLLLDQNGSMTPFHRFSRDLVETALYESSLQPEKVDIFYFHNVPAASLYQDIYLTQPIPLKTALASCDNETSILIVSDGGAARGYRELKRIRATTSFLFQLKRYTALIAWLNPMPETRWIGTSAEIIANLVSMYEMDDNGLSNAIDIIRGQPLPHLHSPLS